MERGTQMNGQQGEILRMYEYENRDCKMRDNKRRIPQNKIAFERIELNVVRCMEGVEE